MQKKDTLEKVIKCMDDGNIHRIFVVSGTIKKKDARTAVMIIYWESSQAVTSSSGLWTLDSQPPFALCVICMIRPR